MKHTPKLLVGFVVIVILALTCWVLLPPDSVSKPLTKLQTRLYLNWIVTGSYAGEAVARARAASDFDLNLEVRPGGQGLDPIRLVGENEFGMASADEILSAASKGADICIVGVVNPVSPTCFISLKSSGIEKPADFKGHRVGMLPFGSTGLVYKALLKAAQIPAGAVTEIVVSPDLRPFILGNTHDVQPAFVYDETVTLDDQGVKYNLIEPKNYGVQLLGVCYFAKAKTVRDNPELVLRFLKAMNQGWKLARENPDRAISDLAQLSSGINFPRELAVLKRGLPYYFRADGSFLVSSNSEWVEMVETLKEFGVLPQGFDYKPHVDFALAEHAVADLDK